MHTPQGNKWALQTAQENLTTGAEWDANLAEVVWPAGWGAVEKVEVTEANAEQVPWLVGNKCFWYSEWPAGCAAGGAAGWPGAAVPVLPAPRRCPPTGDDPRCKPCTALPLQS